MDHDLYSRLNYELKIMESESELYSSRLKALGGAKDSRLKCTVRNGSGKYYYARESGSSNYKYIGSEEDELVLRIKEAAHLKASLNNINQNIVLVKSLLDGYSPFDLGSIDKNLPITYQSKTHFPHSEYQQAGRKWKDEKLIYQAGFPENYPQFKTETTSDGTKVKTVSEVLLYDRFLDAGLAVMYELPLPCVDYGPNLYPDFTILSPIDCKTEIIVEYVGRMDKPGYREDFAKRVYRLMQNGYIPGVNLFFVFSDLEGHVDSLQVNKVISDILGIRR